MPGWTVLLTPPAVFAIAERQHVAELAGLAIDQPSTYRRHPIDGAILAALARWRPAVSQHVRNRVISRWCLLARVASNTLGSVNVEVSPSSPPSGVIKPSEHPPSAYLPTTASRKAPPKHLLSPRRTSIGTPVAGLLDAAVVGSALEGQPRWALSRPDSTQFHSLQVGRCDRRGRDVAASVMDPVAGANWPHTGLSFVTSLDPGSRWRWSLTAPWCTCRMAQPRARCGFVK